jgi:hypothetical protein
MPYVICVFTMRVHSHIKYMQEVSQRFLHSAFEPSPRDHHVFAFCLLSFVLCSHMRTCIPSFPSYSALTCAHVYPPFLKLGYGCGCICLEGFVVGAADNVCEATTSPTNEPTQEPTMPPTESPCDDGTHVCDLGTSKCVPNNAGDGYSSNGAGANLDTLDGSSVGAIQLYSCECVAPFVAIGGGDGTSCVVGPSESPTIAPTHMPTMHSCTDGSHLCDLTSTECVAVGNQVCALYQTHYIS